MEHTEKNQQLKQLIKEAINDKTLYFIIIIAIILRTIFIYSQDFFLDESFQLLMSTQSWTTIFTPIDVHPPFSYIITKLWYNIVPPNIAWYRFLFVIIGVINIPLIYIYAKKITQNRKTALISSLIFAISSTQIFHSAQFRMYELAIMLILLSFITFEFKQKKLNWIFTTLALFTHYFAIFTIILQQLQLLARKEYKELIKYTITFTIPVITALTWAYLQLQKIPGGTWTHNKNLTSFLSTIYYQFFMIKMENAGKLLAIIIAFSFIIIITILLTQNYKKNWQLITLWIIPIILIYAQYMVTGALHHRYLTLYTLFPTIALSTSLITQKYTKTVVMIIIVISGMNLYYLQTNPYEQIRDTCYALPGDALNIHQSTFTYLPCKYMYTPEQQHKLMWKHTQENLKYGGTLLTQQDYIKEYPQQYYIITLNKYDLELIKEIKKIKIYEKK